MYRKIYIDDMIWVCIRICCRYAKISTFLFLFRVFFNNWSFFHWNVPWTSETGFVSSKIPSTTNNAPEKGLPKKEINLPPIDFFGGLRSFRENIHFNRGLPKC